MVEVDITKLDLDIHGYVSKFVGVITDSSNDKKKQILVLLTAM